MHFFGGQTYVPLLFLPNLSSTCMTKKNTGWLGIVTMKMMMLQEACNLDEVMDFSTCDRLSSGI